MQNKRLSASGELHCIAVQNIRDLAITYDEKTYFARLNFDT